MTRKIEGIIPVMLTPFTDQGEIDYPGLERLIDLSAAMIDKGPANDLSCDFVQFEIPYHANYEQIRVILRLSFTLQ
jgi:hypothetical protein